MNEQPHVSDTRAASRLHWTGAVSCVLTVYTAVGFLVWVVIVFFPASSLSHLLALSPLRGFLYLFGYPLGLLFLPFHQVLSPLVQAFLQLILSYLIAFLFAWLALGISGRQAWRKGRRLALGSVILSGIVLVLGGALGAYVYLFILPNFHVTF